MSKYGQWFVLASIFMGVLYINNSNNLQDDEVNSYRYPSESYKQDTSGIVV